MSKISGIYKITNTITGDFYIGSSKDIKRRWREHKCTSKWNEQPNSQLYQDMQKYGVDKFVFEIIAEVEAGSLKEKEQKFIELLKPAYNDRNANGLDIERCKKYNKEYQKEYNKEYKKSDKFKESHRKANNKYYSQLCFYNGQTLTLSALRTRFKKLGIEHPVIEAKKYLIIKESKTPIEFYDVYP